MHLERLRRHLLENSICLEFVHVLLPLLGPAQVTQVGEEKVDLKIIFAIHVARFDVELGAEEHHIVHFHLFLAVADQECLA